MELIKDTIKLGNSAGVLLPKQWLNSRVKIILEPLNVEKDVLDILINENALKDTIGVYIVGSYARKEETIDSDVDILAITNNIDKKIKKGKYDILMISRNELEKQIENNALPLIPMIKESVVIINPELLYEYNNAELTKRNLKWHIDTTKSAIKVIEKDIEISKELTKRNISDNMAYSLILRLRTIYLIDCIKENRLWRKKEFLDLIVNISGSLKAYEGYLRAKNNKKIQNTLPIAEAERLMNYINKEIKKIEND